MTGPDPEANPDAAAVTTGEPADAPPQDVAAGDPLELLVAELAQAQARVQENYDLYLRARAETENARRRGQEEVAKAHKFAIEGFAEAMVPVIDSLEKALESGTDGAAMRAGVEITLRQLRAAFERNRMAEINPLGERFDPHRHQAIATVAAPPDGSVAPNHVASVLQKGWSIADRVLRPALVTVAQAEGS